MDTEQLQLRPYQAKAVDEVVLGTRVGRQSIMLVAPTGAGKTVMGLAAIQRLMEDHEWKVGWCAMRRHLLEQAAETNKQLFGLDIEFFSVFSSNPPQVDILVDDEAHHSAASSIAQLIEATQPRLHLGLSATPYRTDQYQLMFQQVVRSASIEQLIKEGYLAKYEHYVFDGAWTPENVAELYLNDPLSWGKSIMFFNTHHQCYSCADILRAAGVRCEVVTAETAQDHQIEMFKNGCVDVLLNVNVLTEGFDCDNLRTAFIRPAVRIMTEQMGGRALRPKPYTAKIVQNTRTQWQFSEIAKPAAKFTWDGSGWRRMPTSAIGMTAAIVAGGLARVARMRHKMFGGWNG